jgi:hypothetical protein
VAIVRELPGNTVSIRAVAGHIATSVVGQFDLDPQRLLWVEHYPRSVYGKDGEHEIPERYDVIQFTWESTRAISPRWEPLKPPLLDTIRRLDTTE